MENVVAFLKGGDELLVGPDGHIGGRAEPGQISFPSDGIIHGQSLVRAVAGHHHRLAGLAGLAVGHVVLEAIGRIVGGTDGLDLHFFQQRARAEFGSDEAGVAGLPDHRRGLLAERQVDAEITLQFEVSPVVQRIADEFGHGTRPGQEGSVVGRMPGDILFHHAVGAHGAPLVVVAA